MAAQTGRSGKAKRLISCPSCGHRLRFGSTQCGGCWAATPIYNRYWPYWTLGAVLLLIGLLAVALTLA